MDFIIEDNNQKEDGDKKNEEKIKDEINRNIKNYTIEINFNKNYIEIKDYKNQNSKNENNKSLKSDKFRKKIDMFNGVNFKGLDSLYFNGGINKIKLNVK